MKKPIVTLSGLALFIALTSFLGGRKWTHPKGFEKSFTFIEGNAEHTSGFLCSELKCLIWSTGIFFRT
jgi:hypothetical protein